MNLLTHITAVIHTAAVCAGSMWHDHVEPWLSDFLKSTAKAEMDAIVPIATKYVAQVLPSLITAINSGDTTGFADAQWDALKATADAAKAAGINVGITAAASAVSILIAGHPDVVAATAAAPAS